jgi:hypothetical protein
MRHLPATIVVAGICILAAACGNQDAGTSATTTTTTTRIPPVVLEPGLDRLPLLLPPEQINPVMGATGMVVTEAKNVMSDDSATMAPPECLAVDGAAQAKVYETSGFTAQRDQTLRDENLTHYAKQAVVLFPTGKQAEAFFAASAQQWSTCHNYRHTQSGTQWTRGPISNANGVLSTIATLLEASPPGWACGRALAVRNNIIVDVNTCSANPGDTAVTIANQIAAKVPM